MKLAHLSFLEDFGARSVLIHGVMVLTFANAILVGVLIDGQFGTISFVALLNLTAGLWIAHSIHSLGSVTTDDAYTGVLNELLGGVENTESGSEAIEQHRGMDTGRFGRLLALIAAVTAVSLLTAGQILTGALLSVAIVAVGAIALVTAIIGFVIALGAAYDDSQQRTIDRIERSEDAVTVDRQTSNQ